MRPIRSFCPLLLCAWAFAAQSVFADLDFQGRILDRLEDDILVSYVVLGDESSKILIPKASGVSVDGTPKRLVLRDAIKDVSFEPLAPGLAEALKTENWALLQEAVGRTLPTDSQPEFKGQYLQEFAARKWKSASFLFTYSQSGQSTARWVLFVDTGKRLFQITMLASKSDAEAAKDSTMRMLMGFREIPADSL